MHATAFNGSPRELRYTSLGLNVTEADGTFEGYASLFGKPDMADDIIMPGAFRRSLAERGASGIRMLFQHDAHQPIGVWTELREDARGLYAKGQLTLDAAKASEVLALLRAGAIDGLSIGFKALRFRRDARSGIRRLDSVDLWEISVVTFPMMPGARVAHVKASPFGAGVPTEREFERWLTRDAGLTRSEARAVLRSGLNGLKALRDAGGPQDGEMRDLAQRVRAMAQLLSPN
jgi:hypothetical protein